MKTTATKETVLFAIEQVNNEQGYQLDLDRFDTSGKWVNFTLKSKSKIPGARVSWSGRNLAKASWHAHGFVMDKIFEIEPDAELYHLAKRFIKVLNGKIGI